MTALSGERLRQRYLAAMGITLWLPPRPLAGAAASPRWVWQPLPPAEDAAPSVSSTVPSAAVDSAAPPSPSAGAEPVTPSRPKARVDVRSRIGIADLSDKAEAAAPAPAPVPEPTVAAPTSSAEPSAVPRFRLWLVRYENCLVLNDLPLDESQPVVQQHHALLKAILAAVNLGGEQQLSSVLSWPMFAPQSGYDQSADVARLMLREELGLDQLSEPLPLLLLGEQAGQHLLDPVTAYSATVVRGPSLNEMLRIPERKAELWRALQPLRP